MYCPTCGTKLTHALSYCNHCGANLPGMERGDDKKSTQASTDTLIWVIVGTTITLLGMGLGALVLINDGAIDRDLGRIFVLLSFAAFFIVEGILVWRLLKLNRENQERRGLAQPKDQDEAMLNAAETRALKDPGEPIPTEQATQVFEPSYKNDR